MFRNFFGPEELSRYHATGTKGAMTESLSGFGAAVLGWLESQTARDVDKRGREEVRDVGTSLNWNGTTLRLKTRSRREPYVSLDATMDETSLTVTYGTAELLAFEVSDGVRAAVDVDALDKIKELVVPAIDTADLLDLLLALPWFDASRFPDVRTALFEDLLVDLCDQEGSDEGLSDSDDDDRQFGERRRKIRRNDDP